MNLFTFLIDITSFSLILLLVAVGLGVIFGLMRIINLAHGEFFMLGAYASYMTVQLTGNLWLGIILAPMATALLGFFLEFFLFRILYRRPLDSILASLGLSVLLRQSVILFFGPAILSIDPPLDRSLLILGDVYPLYRLVVMGLAFLVLGITFFLFYRSRFGLWLRASMADREMAQAMGIHSRMVDNISFTYGAGLAGFSGAVIAPLITIHPHMGTGYLVPSFLAVLIGGGLTGTVVVVFLIGLCQNSISSFFSPVSAQITVLFLAILAIRFPPQKLKGIKWRN